MPKELMCRAVCATYKLSCALTYAHTCKHICRRYTYQHVFAHLHASLHAARVPLSILRSLLITAGRTRWSTVVRTGVRVSPQAIELPIHVSAALVTHFPHMLFTHKLLIFILLPRGLSLIFRTIPPSSAFPSIRVQTDFFLLNADFLLFKDLICDF